MVTVIDQGLDFWPTAVENESSGRIASEAQMGKVEDAESRLDKRINGVLYGGWVVLVILLGWLGTGTYYIFTMSGDIRAIKQDLKDHGSEIVQKIERPKDTEQLVANLALATAELQVARAEHRKPDGAKIASLQHAISNASNEHPNLPAVWSAAAELISYRSNASRRFPEDLLPCDLEDIKPEVKSTKLADGVVIFTTGFYLSGCSLELEDVPKMPVTDVGPFHAEGGAKMILSLHLTDGEVIYRGGPIRYTGGFVFEDCSFNLQTSAVPSSPVRRILSAGLTNIDLINVAPAA